MSSPSVMGYCFQLLDPVFEKRKITLRESFLMGYVAGKYGASALQKSAGLYDEICELRTKFEIKEEMLTETYSVIFSNNVAGVHTHA